eukprot:s1908_g4.t1
MTCDYSAWRLRNSPTPGDASANLSTTSCGGALQTTFAHESGVPHGDRAAAPPWSCLGKAAASPDAEERCGTPLKTGMWSGTHLAKRQCTCEHHAAEVAGGP